MIRTGRILVVEPGAELRAQIDAQLEREGHEVASCPDSGAAFRLLEEGLEPDVVVVAGDAGEGRSWNELAPWATHLVLDSSLAESHDFLNTDGVPRCSTQPQEVARCVEEILLTRQVAAFENSGDRCLEVASRLASGLRETRSLEERVETILDILETYFGLKGSIVVRRTRGMDNWVMASQGVTDELADQMFQVIEKRSQVRSIRPFFTKVDSSGATHSLVGIPVGLGENEVTLVVSLVWTPSEARIRQSLLQLIGTAVRSAHALERLNESEALLSAHATSFEHVIMMTRDLTRAHRRAALCESALEALRREIPAERSCIFLFRDGEAGLLDLQAANGFGPHRLDRIGLSRHHGVGAVAMRADGPISLAEIPREGAAVREINLLHEVGLHRVAPLVDENETWGVLFFGELDQEEDLSKSQLHSFRALLGAAAIALRNLRKVERLERLSAGGIRALVEAFEVLHPEERGHPDRVALLSRALGDAAGLDRTRLQSLTIGALLHDVGKIGGAVGALEMNPERRAKLHPILGSQILSRTKPDPEIIQAVEQHHERYDGQGHPYGLRGEAIHLYGRIVAIANSYDRLTRRGQESLTPKEALTRLQRGAGLLFDPGLVALFTGEIERNPDLANEPRPADWFLEEGVSR